MTISPSASSAYRVTQRSVGLRTLAGLESNLSRLGTLQEQLSSGRAISRPSDSPTGTVSAMQIRSEVRTNEQWSRNADDGLGWLNTIDTTLTSSLASLRRARELTLRGMSTGSASQESRDAMAAELDKIKETLVGLANTGYLDRPVFGGTTAGTRAYDDAGAYLGEPAGTRPPRPGEPASTEPYGVRRTVGADASVRVDITGPEVFGTGGNAVFGIIDDIAADLRTAPSALSADLGRLDGAMKLIQEKLADVGARAGRVEQMRQAADDRVITLRSSLAEVENIDLPKTMVDLQMQQVAYQAALSATSRVITPSLVDFLR